MKNRSVVIFNIASCAAAITTGLIIWYVTEPDSATNRLVIGLSLLLQGFALGWAMAVVLMWYFIKSLNHTIARKIIFGSLWDEDLTLVSQHVKLEGTFPLEAYDDEQCCRINAAALVLNHTES